MSVDIPLILASTYYQEEKKSSLSVVAVVLAVERFVFRAQREHGAMMQCLQEDCREA